jgi:tRNA (guanine-N7-)-methyltransferase
MVDLESYHFELATLAAPLSWSAFFGNAQPVELEIGSGKGLFLANAATARPGHNFLGIEISHKYARRAAERVAKRTLPNVKVIQGDARIFMSRHVPAASVQAVHIYFPDPWWKKRHKKRRVFTAEFVGQVERALVPDGEFWLATDVGEYYGVMTEIMAAFPRFAALPLPEPNTPEHDLDYLTNFERKYRIEGRAIYRGGYRLAGPALANAAQLP